MRGTSEAFPESYKEWMREEKGRVKEPFPGIFRERKKDLDMLSRYVWKVYRGSYLEVGKEEMEYLTRTPPRVLSTFIYKTTFEELRHLMRKLGEEYIGKIIDNTIYEPGEVSEEGPIYFINNTIIKDYYEPPRDTVCFIWLASTHFRDDVKKFEKLLEEFGEEHRPDALIVEYHHNIRGTTVEDILEALNLKLSDLPVLIMSKRVIDSLSPKTDDVIIIKEEFMDELLKLPDDSLRKLIDKFYIEMSGESNFKEIEKKIKDFIRQEIEELSGKIPENILNKLKRLIDIGVSVATLIRTITLFAQFYHP